MPAAGRRRIYIEARPQRGFQSRLTFIDGNTVFRPYVDAVKSAASAEYLLSGVNVHDGKVAAKCACHSGRTHDSAHSELLDPLDGREWNLAVDR